MQLLIEISPEMYEQFKLIQIYPTDKIIANGIPLPEHHGDLKDIGNMELLNVQVHDNYSEGWHNAIEYCVRQLRERPTIIPATEEEE